MHIQQAAEIPQGCFLLGCQFYTLLLEGLFLLGRQFLPGLAIKIDI